MKIGVGRKNATNVPGVGKVWRVNKAWNRSATPQPASKTARQSLYKALGGTLKKK